jgi:hypothetical protein
MVLFCWGQTIEHKVASDFVEIPTGIILGILVYVV